MFLADAEGVQIIAAVLQFFAMIAALSSALFALAALHRNSEEQRDNWRKTRLIEVGIAFEKAIGRWKEGARHYHATTASARPSFYPAVVTPMDELWHCKAVLKLLRESTLEGRVHDYIQEAERVADDLQKAYKAPVLEVGVLERAFFKLDCLCTSVIGDFQTRVDSLDTRPIKILWWFR